MNDKPKEKVYAERFDASKKRTRRTFKKAIDQHEKNKPQKKESRKFKFPKRRFIIKLKKRTNRSLILSVLFIQLYPLYLKIII